MMQPYLFPYLGYFQLIYACDYFGIADDVQYIKKGWINRNNILNRSDVLSFSFSVKKGTFNAPIKDRLYAENIDYEKKKFIKILTQCYSKAPQFESVLGLINDIFDFPGAGVSEFNLNQLQKICDYLEIKTVFILSKSWNNNYVEEENDSSEQKLIKKLKNLQALNCENYINPIGGIELYSKKTFAEKGIELNFLKMKNITYEQFSTDFVPNLSIIDVLMFNTKDQIMKLLNQFELV